MSAPLIAEPAMSARRGLRTTWFVALIAVLVYAAIAGVYHAAHRPFDFDEIATIAVVGDRSTAAIWRALQAAADASPPVFYMVEALSAGLVGDPHVAFRLPTLIAFLLTPVALFLFVGRRCGGAAGLAAGLFPMVTPLFTFYPLEARPYTLMACAVTWACVMWQRADTRRSAAGFGVLLAAATAFHYYAVFALIPFVLAELTRTVRSGELRRRVWIAMPAGVLPIAAFWPLLSQFNQQYGGGFWARPQLLNSYTELLGVSERWAFPLVLLLIAAAIATAVGRRDPLPASAPPAVPIDYWVLGLGLIGLPAVLYVAAVAFGTVMVPRYAITAVSGMAIVAAMVAASLARSGVRWLLLGLVLITAFQQLDRWRFGQVSTRNVADHGDVGRLRAMTDRAAPQGLPVVVSNALRYLPMAYYAPRSGPPAFVYLLDRAAALDAIGTDSAERGLESLAPHLEIDLEARAPFLAAYPRFLLFSENEYWDWLPGRLLADGYSLRLLAQDTTGGVNHMLYLVEIASASRSTPQ